MKRSLLNLALILVTLILVAAGCATPEANPPAPRANRGYADFYAEPAGDVYWRIEQWDESSSQFKERYSKFAPPEHGIVRLELPPGPHRFRITFVNMAIEAPVDTEVDILPEKVSPVAVRRMSVSETYVRSVEDKVRHAGRRRDVTDDQQMIYRLVPRSQAPEPYQQKAKMRYAQ